MKCNDYELFACRDKVFDCLCEVWTDAKNADSEAWKIDIWRKANTLQTVAQYWHSITNVTRRQKAMSIMKEGYNFYLTRKADKSLWVDDFGWWGGFFGDLAAYTQAVPLASPFDDKNLLSEAKDCYTRMLGNLDQAQGGIWNHIDIPPNPNDITVQRNTVTNAWMLNLASGLFPWTGSADYKYMAEVQYKWLTTGKYKNYSPLSWVLYASNGLLLWLPGPSNTFQYWSGDEGVFLRGLLWYINYVITDPNTKQEFLRNSKNLITAAIKTFADAEHVMHASPDSPNGQSNDLATGKGVFMRLVTRFVHTFKYFDDKKFEQDFKEFVDLTAESVWCSRDKTTNRTAPNWNPKYNPSGESGLPTDGDLWPQVWQTDGLDALNAAVLIRAVA